MQCQYKKNFKNKCHLRITKARIWRPANASQKYLLACHPYSGRQETAGQPISRQSPKLQLILVHIYTD